MRKFLIAASTVAAAAMLAGPANADPGQGRWGGCPPGLAKKGNGCMPPGQARKYYWDRGARVPAGYRGWTRYDAIPRAYRMRVPYNARYRYVYRDDYVYVVDPQTRLVRDIIDLLSR